MEGTTNALLSRSPFPFVYPRAVWANVALCSLSDDLVRTGVGYQKLIKGTPHAKAVTFQRAASCPQSYGGAVIESVSKCQPYMLSGCRHNVSPLMYLPNMSCHLSQSELQSSPAQTVSEVYPDDSASHRAATREIQGLQDGESVFSLHPSDGESLYTVIGGRTFTSHSETYMLPADQEEHRRLNLQHNLLRLSLNGLFAFPELVTPLLPEGHAEPPHILDVGAGSGQWALDMAATYPWANVIGMDLVPPALISLDNIPSNLRFEIDDANLRMDHYTNLFSVVHARTVSSGLNDVNYFFYEMARILKPGGVFLMVDGLPQIRDENLTPFPFVEPGEPNFTWFQYFCCQARFARWNRGSRIHKFWWKEWLESNPNYSEVRQQDLDVPVGAWKEGMTDQEAVAANMMRENIYNILGSWRPLLVGDGHPEEDVDLWIEECKKELKEMRVHCYVRFWYFAAVRSRTPWQDRGDWTPPDEATREQVKGLDLTKPHKRRHQTAQGIFEAA